MITDYTQYELEVKRTMHARLADLTDLAVYALGICGELGEVQTAGQEDYKEELGDLCWYLFAYTIAYRELFDIPAPTDARPLVGVEMQPYPGMDALVLSQRLAQDSCTRAALVLAEHTKKVVGYNKPANPELVHTSLAILLQPLTEFPVETMSEILTANVNKLRARYPEGFKIV